MIDAELHTIEITTLVKSNLQSRTYRDAWLQDKGSFIKVFHGDKENWFARQTVVRVRVGPVAADSGANHD